MHPLQETRVHSLVRELRSHKLYRTANKKKNLPLSFRNIWASQIAQQGRICLPLQETQVRSLGQEDPLEEEMATHSSVLPWRIPWTEEPGGHKESDTTEHIHSFIIYTSTSNQHVFITYPLIKHCVLHSSSF